MLESKVNGMIYQVSTFTIVDRKTGKENGMINVQYIYKASEDSATKLGWSSGQAYFIFSDEVFKQIKNEFLLKKVELTFKLVPDYKDSTKYTSKLTQIGELVIKQ